MTIALPIAIDQGYFRHSIYALPCLGLAAAITYVFLFATSQTCKLHLNKFNDGFSRRHEAAGLLIVEVLILAVLVLLVAGFWVAVKKSGDHVAELRKAEGNLVPTEASKAAVPNAPNDNVSVSDRVDATVKRAPAISVEVHRAQPPLTGSVRFSVLVPFVSSWPKGPIPLDDNLQDSHNDFYSRLQWLAMQPENPRKDQPAYAPRNFADEQEQFVFVARLIQYYLVEAIDTLRRGQQGTKFIAGVGVMTINKDPIPFPQAEPYPLSTMKGQLAANDFFVHAISDRMVWKNSPIQLPIDSVLELTEQNETGKPFVAFVSIERKGYYKIQFSVEPFGAMKDQLPAGFSTRAQQLKADTHNVTITMDYRIQQREGFDAQGYVAWAKALFAGLKDLTGFN